MGFFAAEVGYFANLLVVARVLTAMSWWCSAFKGQSADLPRTANLSLLVASTHFPPIKDRVSSSEGSLNCTSD